MHLVEAALADVMYQAADQKRLQTQSQLNTRSFLQFQIWGE